jgi:hypothetical protein
MGVPGGGVRGVRGNHLAGLRPRHEFADIVVPWSSPGRMARRHPDRTANRTTAIRRPRPSVHTSNNRNGYTGKTVQTEVGQVDLAVPRDRDSSFEPRLVPKGSRRLAGGLDEMIISLYAGGMTVRDIGFHVERTLGVELSHDTISKITDGILEEVKAWQTRPLDPIYPILYIDALVVKVRDGAHVVNKAAHIVVGWTPMASNTCWASGCNRARALSSGSAY